MTVPHESIAESKTHTNAFGGGSALLVWLVTIALSTVTIWTAWDYGGGYLRTKFVMAVTTLAVLPIFALSVVMLPKSGRLQHRRPPTLTLIACVIWLAGIVQTLSLPSGLVELLSPGSAAAYIDWVPDSVAYEAASASPPRSVDPRISVAPAYTQMALFVPLVFGAICWFSSYCFSFHRAALIFLAMAALAGGVFSFFGLGDAMLLARTENFELRQRLLISPVGADGPFGPFVHNANCAGYLCLTIGCGIGLLIYLTNRSESNAATKGNSFRFVELATDPTVLIRRWPVIAVGLLVIISITGILGSGSRGGMLGLAAGCGVFLVASLRSLPKIRLIVAVVGVVALSILLLHGIGLVEYTEGRLQTLVGEKAKQEPRLAHWQDGLRAAAAYFPAGAGIGSYRYAYLPYQATGGKQWFVNADGMHVELLVEGGIWLLPLVLVGVVMVVRDRRVVARNLGQLSPADARLARAIVGCVTFVVPSMLVTQCFDYGILQPSLLATLAFICGGLHWAKSRVKTSVSGPTPPTQSNRLVLTTFSAFAMVVGLCFATSALKTGATIQRIDRQRIARSSESAGVPWDNESEIETVRAIVNEAPKRSDARLLFAQLLVNQQRRVGAKFLLDNGHAELDELNRWVSPRTVRQAYYGASGTRPIEELMLPGQELAIWQQAHGHAAASIADCPLNDLARIMLVETDMVHDRASQSSHELILQSAQLRRRNPEYVQRLKLLAEVYPADDTVDQIADIVAGNDRNLPAQTAVPERPESGQ